jgi:extensin-like protein
MTRGVRWYLVGSLVLLALAGCGRSFFAEREPWRREAEEQCLKSGAVKQSAAIVIQKPIQGPGICGADFPLRVAALGESTVIGYADEPLRPPGLVPRGGTSTFPRAPIPASPVQVQQAAPPSSVPSQPRTGTPSYGPGPSYGPSHSIEPGYVPSSPYERAPAYEPRPAYEQQPYEPPQQMQPDYSPYRQSPPPSSQPPSARPLTRGPISLTPPGLESQRDDQRYSAPVTSPYGLPPKSYPSGANQPVHSVPLSPSRGTPQVTGSIAATVTPTATLACPIVSALDQWMIAAVQPAAHKWFGQHVVEIRQISAYSCRGMNGNPNAKISEHAFGNALDIASFILTDGRKVTVKDGWNGAPEEQGFLRDIQAAACAQFSTVLAPGSNVYHYDHIHVDLMRRASARNICEPGAVSGEVVAARARARYGRRLGDPGVTGTVAPSVAAASTPPSRNSAPLHLELDTIDDDRHHPMR